MTSPIARPRYMVGIVLLFLISGCRPPDARLAVSVVDLTRQCDRGEKRPATGFHVTAYSLGGITHPAIVAPVPSRFTCALRLPRRGVFHAYAALADPSPDAPALPVRAWARKCWRKPSDKRTKAV